MILEWAFMWTRNMTRGLGDTRDDAFYAARDVSREQKQLQNISNCCFFEHYKVYFE